MLTVQFKSIHTLIMDMNLWLLVLSRKCGELMLVIMMDIKNKKVLTNL